MLQKLEPTEVKQNNYFAQRKWIHSEQLSAKQDGTKLGNESSEKFRTTECNKTHKEKKKKIRTTFLGLEKILKTTDRKKIPWKTTEKADKELCNAIGGLLNMWRKTVVYTNERWRTVRRNSCWPLLTDILT